MFMKGSRRSSDDFFNENDSNSWENWVIGLLPKYFQGSLIRDTHVVMYRVISVDKVLLPKPI